MGLTWLKIEMRRKLQRQGRGKRTEGLREEYMAVNCYRYQQVKKGSEETLQKFLRVLFPNDVDKENDTEPQQQLRKEIESTGYRGVLPHKSGQ
ncbi:hypothetical protein J6590_056596 [Homalodisca vitripennis]|nr:hypothetical protein J6590_056595 [Homalodisca vitripennis]KAG8320964.1 hypothetical protein J6590_056596 [Homalodisca vitripennis]